MKTKTEFLDLFANDEAFAKDVSEQIAIKKQQGEQNLFDAVAIIAAEKGYEISAGDVEEYFQNHDCELSDELIAEVSGGANCGPGVGDGHEYKPKDEDTTAAETTSISSSSSSSSSSKGICH